MENIQHKFWVIKPSYEQYLREHQEKKTQDERAQEDWQYLEGVRGMNRNATLGPLDTNLQKRRKINIY